MDMNTLDQDAAVGRGRQRQSRTEDVPPQAQVREDAVASQWLGASEGDALPEPLTEVRIPSSAPPGVRPAAAEDMRRVVPIVAVDQVQEQIRLPPAAVADAVPTMGRNAPSEPHLDDSGKSKTDQVSIPESSAPLGEIFEVEPARVNEYGAETAKDIESASIEGASQKPKSSSTIAGKLKGFLESMRKKEAERKATQKRVEEDEKNKQASVKKRNPAKIIAVILIGGVLLSIAAQRWRNSVEQTAAADSATKANNQKAIAAATALLDPASSPTTSNSAKAVQPAASARAESAPVESSQYTPPPAPCGDGPPGEDKYMKQLRLLKCDLKNSPDMGKKASRLPEEIANAEIPGGRRASGEVRPRPAVEQDPVAPRVPDLIESSEQKGAAKPDPLARVAVMSSVSVDRAGTSPYLLVQARQTQGGPAAFIFPKNSDPLISGRWFYVGDQTDEGWTVVSIVSGTVNIVSPQGKVYQIHS